MPTLTAQLWNAANTSKIADLTESFDRRWQDPVSEVGSGQLSVLADDAAAPLMTIGTNVRFLIDNVARFTFRVDRRQARTVDRGEESAQAVAVSGPGIVADWGDAVVYPQGGVNARPQSDTRLFSWCSPELSTSSWATAFQQFPNACIPNVYDLVTGWPPLGWPAPVLSSSVRWIWSRAFALHPAGYSLFRKSFTLASTKQCALFVSAGGRARAFVDAVECIPWTSTFPNWSSGYTTSSVFTITAGTHELAIEAENFDFTGLYSSPGSIGCVIAALHSVPASGSFSSSTLIAGTDTTWKMQDYVSPYPAPTPGTILSTLLSEAQARGALSGWSFGGSFSPSVDSAGASWASSREVALRVGDSLLQVLKQMTDLQLIDWRADAASKTLRVWNWGTQLANSGVTLAAGTNLLELNIGSEVV